MASEERKAANNYVEHVRPASRLPEEKKLSHAFCKKFLEDSGGNYSDEQVAQIRETLYLLAEIDYLITTSKVITPDQENEQPP